MGRRWTRSVVWATCAALTYTPWGVQAAEQTVELNSNGDYASMRLPDGAREVDLVEQRSGACRFNRTWGYDLSNKELWVNGGCSGRFRITGDLRSDDNASSNTGAAVAAALAVAGIAVLASRHGDRDRPYGPPNESPDWGYGGGRSGNIRGQGGLCLDMRGREVSQGTEAIVYPCNGGRNQRFRWTRNGELQVGGMCLDIANGSNANGAMLIAWPCNGGRNQRWYSSGSSIRSGQNGRCIDVFQGVARPEQPVVVWDCNGRANQRWWW